MNDAAAHVHVQFDDAEQQLTASTLGMWVFLATEVLLFGALFCSYASYRFTYPRAFVLASGHTDALLGTVETGVLLTSSLTMALAVRAVRLGTARAAAWLLVASALLGAAFLGIHGYEYVHEWHEHLFPGSGFDPYLGGRAGAQMFFELYYTMTGLHALHVSIGVAMLAVLARLAARRRVTPQWYTPVELGGLYWHLVDIVWVFLYPLFYLVGRV